MVINLDVKYFDQVALLCVGRMFVNDKIPRYQWIVLMCCNININTLNSVLDSINVLKFTL